MPRGVRRGLVASGRCSIRGQIGGQRANGMLAWWLTQPGGSDFDTVIADDAPTHTAAVKANDVLQTETQDDSVQTLKADL